MGRRTVDHVCLAAGPFDPKALRDHLSNHAVEIKREAMHGGARRRGHSFYSRAPFGNLIDLKGAPDHPDNPELGEHIAAMIT